MHAEDRILSRFSLAGKVAIVTGGSSGLGVAFAQGLAEAGADVVIGARRFERLSDTSDLVRAAGRQVLAVKADVTQRQDCQALVDRAMERFGRVDILINNAGTGGKNHEVSVDPPEHWLSVIDVNLNASYWMLQACGPVLQPGSSVVNISSIMAVTTARMPASAYSASKAAVLGLTRDVAAQWAPRGVRVNALLPGMFPSEATAHYSQNYKDKIIAVRIPLGREGDPSDVAAAAVFLASDAASYITGAALPVEGGLLLL